MTLNPSPLAAREPGVQQQAQARKSLMLRSAKIVCQAGEYICVVRDVSETGTTLSFLHETPAEGRIILVLANGLTYPIERVWADARQAGYRFASDIAPDEFIHTDRPFHTRPIRLGLRAIAQITDGRAGCPAQMTDISSQGARIESMGDWREQQLVNFHVTGLPQRLATVAWREQGPTFAAYGLEFQHPIPLADLAIGAYRLQPFDAPLPGGYTEALPKVQAA
jgi:hypothetical protein